MPVHAEMTRPTPDRVRPDVSADAASVPSSSPGSSTDLSHVSRCTPQSPTCARARCFHVDNRIHRGASLQLTLGSLSAERAIRRVTSSQVTRSVGLSWRTREPNDRSQTAPHRAGEFQEASVRLIFFKHRPGRELYNPHGGRRIHAGRSRPVLVRPRRPEDRVNARRRCARIQHQRLEFVSGR